MTIEPGAVLALGMFVTACAALMAGFPVAFTLAGTALAFAAIGFFLEWAVDLPIPLDWTYLGLMPDRIFGVMVNDTLLAIPLFVAMGVVLERSKVAEDLLEAMAQLLGRVRGGLAVAVSIVGGLLAASTGVVGATVVTMGLLALPTMLKRGYDPKLAAGSISAAGTLGQIIPPSIVLVLLADVLSSASQEAQRELGITSPDPLSVGELFAGALIPGVGLVLLYILYQVIVAILRPEKAPALTDEDLGVKPPLSYILRALIAPVVLILSVLGSILLGIATPSEAAAVGALGAILLGCARLVPGSRMGVAITALALLSMLALAMTTDVSAQGGHPVLYGVALALAGVFAIGLAYALITLWRVNVLTPVLRSSTLITTMVYTILIGAALFSLVFRGLGGDDVVHHWLSNMPGGVVGAMIVVMALMFVLGFFLDFIEIVFVVVPIVAPVLLLMGVDPIWLAIMIAVNLQTSFLTPPFGFALFYLRGVAPPSVKTSDIWKGSIPFVSIQIGMLLILTAFPALATWLPKVVFGD
jgi:tripartite ATP-independent transporter DctM subunit